QLARGKLTHHLQEIFDGGADLDLKAKLLSLPLDEFHHVIDQLQRRLGVRDRSLVERLAHAYLNPHRINQFTIHDTMELASIFTLSGTMNTKRLYSGFGLYGIKILAPSSGVHYLHYTIPHGDAVGTETVLAVQSLGGFMHTEPIIRGMIESGAAAC